MEHIRRLPSRTIPTAREGKESIYPKAKALAEENFDAAISLFSSLNNYSQRKSGQRNQEIRRKPYCPGDYDNASKAFSLFGNFSDSGKGRNPPIKR